MDVLDPVDGAIFETRTVLPWGSFRLGDGFDVQTGQALPSPLEVFDLGSDKPLDKFMFDSRTISSQHNVNDAIEFSGKISASLFKVGGDASANYLHSARFSETSLTTIMHVTKRCSRNEYKVKPTLTPEAEKVLRRGSEHFFRQYGQFFVSGRICQTSFLATITHTASSREQLRSFKGSLGVNYKISSAEVASEYVHKAGATGITTSAYVEMTGYAGPTSSAALSGDTLLLALDDFLSNVDRYEPSPHEATLEHYFWLDARIPRPTCGFQLFSPQDKALRKCLGLEMQCRSSGLRILSRLMPEVTMQRRRILAIDMRGDNPNDEIRAWAHGFQEMQAEVDKGTAVQSLLDTIPSDRWMPLNCTRAHTQAHWVPGTRETFNSAGALPPFDELASGHIQLHTLDFKRASGLGRQSGRLRFDFDDRIIIGARLNNGWADGTNADWKLRDGWPDRQAMSMEVEFKCQFGRGADWGFQVWSLPRALCL